MGIKNLFGKKSSTDIVAEIGGNGNGNSNGIGGHAVTDGAAEVAKKKPRNKFILPLALVLFLVVSFLVVFSLGGTLGHKKPMVSNNQYAVRTIGTPTVQAAVVPSPAAPLIASVQPQPIAAKTTAAIQRTLAPASAKASADNGARDVFKDFYTKHLSLVGKVPGDISGKLPDLSKEIRVDPAMASLPRVQTITAPPVEEKPVTIYISGITCVTAGTCTAITNLGILQVGDKIGNEYVEGINRAMIMTNKRMVVFN